MDNVVANEIAVEESKPAGKKVILIIFLVLIGFNLLFLDYFIFMHKKPADVNDQRIQAVENQAWSLTKKLADMSFNQATSSSKERVIIPTLIPIPTSEPAPIAETAEPTPTPMAKVKEFYVPLGSASLASENFSWKDTGAEAALDLANYPNVRQIVFEATLSVPSGQVEARLYNVSNGYEIGGSVLVGDGYSPKLYRSGNISLPSGAKTYRVQMRTSLNATGNLDLARLKISLN